MIKGIIFDLDDTLTIHDELYDKNYLKIINKFSPKFKIDQEKILNIIISTIHQIGTEKKFSKYIQTKFGGRDILWGDCGGKGIVNEYLSKRFFEIRIEIWTEVFKNLCIEISNKDILKIINNYKFSMWEGIKTFDDVIPTLIKLKDIKLGVLTNGMDLHQRRKMAKAGILSFFSGANREIVTSSESIEGKPSKKPFEIILEKLGLSNDEVFMVGDRPESDILGANNMGITSILINREKQKFKNNFIVPNYEISNLKELLEIDL